MINRLSMLNPPIRPWLSKKTILIVDDDETALLLLHRVVEKAEGVERIFSVSNGVSGIRCMIASANEIGVVILDLAMPYPNGFEMCHFIRTIPEVANLPIIILTAHSLNEVVEQARICGANYLMSKPFDNSELRKLVSSCLTV